MIEQKIVAYRDIEEANAALDLFLNDGWRAVSVSTTANKDPFGMKAVQITYLIERGNGKWRKTQKKGLGAHLT